MAPSTLSCPSAVSVAGVFAPLPMPIVPPQPPLDVEPSRNADAARVTFPSASIPILPAWPAGTPVVPSAETPTVPARLTSRALSVIAPPSGPIVSPAAAFPRAVILAPASTLSSPATWMVSAVRRQRAGGAQSASEAHAVAGSGAQRAVKPTVRVLRTRTLGAVKVSTLPSGRVWSAAITQVSAVDCRASQRESPVCAAARPASASRASSPVSRTHAPERLVMP